MRIDVLGHVGSSSSDSTSSSTISAQPVVVAVPAVVPFVHSLGTAYFAFTTLHIHTKTRTHMCTLARAHTHTHTFTPPTSQPTHTTPPPPFFPPSPLSRTHSKARTPTHLHGCRHSLSYTLSVTHTLFLLVALSFALSGEMNQAQIAVAVATQDHRPPPPPNCPAPFWQLMQHCWQVCIDLLRTRSVTDAEQTQNVFSNSHRTCSVGICFLAPLSSSLPLGPMCACCFALCAR